MRTAVAIGLGVLGLAAVGGIAYAANSPGAAAPTAAPTASSFSSSAAVPVAPGSSVTITIGSSLTVESSGGAAVTSSNPAAVVAAPASTAFPTGMTNGFVAIATGTSDLTTASGGVVHVTVVTSMAAAAGTTTSTFQSSGSGSTTSSLPAGSPRGLVASASTSTGWAMHIAITPNVSGLSYQGFYGDVVRISLPAGAHWRASSASMGPATGTDDFVFTLIEPVTVVLSYTDSASLDTGTTLSFDIGGVFEKTTAIATNDYVIFALAQTDLQATFAALVAAINAGASGTTESQEAQTMQSLAAALAGGSSTATVENLLTWFFLSGPWAATWALDPHSIAILPPATPVPSWWPTDDTAAASEAHVIARYVGSGIQVSAAPFPVTAWKRVA